MDAKILALIKTNQKRRLMPEEIAAVNAYVTDGKTSDLIQLGTEVGSNAINYHKSKAKLSDHGEYLGAVKSGFDHLSKESLIDNEKKWPRWLEATFHAYDKNQKDYFTKLANAHIKLLRNDQPKPKINYKTLALDLSRMILAGDRDGAEKLAQQIAQENGDKIEKAENSAFSSQTTTSVKDTPKPKKTHVFGSQNHEEDGTDTITGLCGQMLFDPAITFSRDADPKNVTCSVCKLLLKKQQKRLKENGSKLDTTGPVVHTLLSCGDGKYYAACDPQTAVPFHTRKATCTECLKIKAATPPKAKTHARSSYNSKTRCNRWINESMLVVEDGVQPTCGRCLKKLKEIADRKADYERQQAEADAYTAERKAEFEEALVSLIDGKDAEISGGFNLHWHEDSVIVTGPENYFDGDNQMEFATPTEAILRLADDACIEIGGPAAYLTACATLRHNKLQQHTMEIA